MMEMACLTEMWVNMFTASNDNSVYASLEEFLIVRQKLKSLVVRNQSARYLASLIVKCHNQTDGLAGFMQVIRPYTLRKAEFIM